MITQPQTEADVRYACPPKRFEKHMAMLRQKYNVISLHDIASAIENDKALPENSVAVTIDDGFEDNYTNAFPILKKYEIPATIFLATGFMSKRNEWMKAGGFSQNPMLSWSQIKEMHQAGIDFGGHTVNHVKLSELDDDEAYREIFNGRQETMQQLQSDVPHFAYPFGLYKDESTGLTKKAGFKLACSTRSGFNSKDADPYLLRRLEVYGTDSTYILRQKISFGVNDSELTFPVKYYWKRVMTRLGISHGH